MPLPLNKPIVLILRPLDPEIYGKAQQDPHISFYSHSQWRDLSPHFPHCRGLILGASTRVDENFLKLFPQLEFVVSATSGFDHMDLKALEKRGIPAFHTPEAPVGATAELTLLMMLACCRKFSLALHQIQKGLWHRDSLLGRPLQGQTLGRLGLGRVGEEVALKAQALGLTVQAFDPYRESPPESVPRMGFEELMRSSDIVSLHVPQTPRTRHMICEKTLSWMSPRGILLNLSRGDVVHEQDLIHHLKENREFCAGLDVFHKEPLPSHSPLLGLPNVCLTPHLGARTDFSLKKSSQQALEAARLFLQGETPAHRLPPSAPWWEPSSQG